MMIIVFDIVHFLDRDRAVENNDEDWKMTQRRTRLF